MEIVLSVCSLITLTKLDYFTLHYADRSLCKTVGLPVCFITSSSSVRVVNGLMLAELDSLVWFFKVLTIYERTSQYFSEGSSQHHKTYRANRKSEKAIHLENNLQAKEKLLDTTRSESESQLRENANDPTSQHELEYFLIILPHYALFHSHCLSLVLLLIILSSLDCFY